MPKTYNLFISHSWSYGDAYDRLVSMLDERPNFFYRNYSVPKDDPIHNAPDSQALYEAIKRQITPCHIVLIMAGKYATFSKWITKEIRIAKGAFTISKPILAIKPWGANQISSTVRENADMEVGWNSSSIVDAIRTIALS